MFGLMQCIVGLIFEGFTANLNCYCRLYLFTGIGVVCFIAYSSL